MNLNNLGERARSKLARTRLGARDFCIISNNCWGTHAYLTLRRQFNTPFIALFISPTSYLRLLTDFPQSLFWPLKFKTVSDEGWINRVRAAHHTPWPIGSLGDGIEIQFMHYGSEEEARETWQRRSARVPTEPDRLFFKFCDRDDYTPDQLATFDQLPFRNKVFFTTRKDCPVRCAVRIPWHEDRVPDGLVLSRVSPAYFDGVDWLNGGSGRVKWWGRRLNCV